MKILLWDFIRNVIFCGIIDFPNPPNMIVVAIMFVRMNYGKIGWYMCVVRRGSLIITVAVVLKLTVIRVDLNILDIKAAHEFRCSL